MGSDLVADKFRNSYFESLPRFSKWTWERSVTTIGSVASIVGVAGLIFKWERLEKSQLDLYGTLYLFIIVCVLMIYIFIRETKKRHRYALAVYHVHYVNHAIRDCLSDLQIGRNQTLHSVLENIVNSIAFCFSIVEGRQCRCSIKEVLHVPDLEIQTVARDTISRQFSVNTDRERHLVSENSDFEKLWNGEKGYARYFQGTNLKMMWSRGGYKNSSFRVVGEPERLDIFTITLVRKWNLPYRGLSL